MAISSRRSLLPRLPEKTISPLWVLLFILAVWMVPIILGQPTILVAGIFLFSLPVFSVLCLISHLFGRNRLRQLAEKRNNESICTFARSFNHRHIDTRIIRAVYEEVQHWCGGECPNFPLRASDHFEKDLDVDPEDLEDMVQVIAFRTKRALDGFEQNPFYPQVNTAAGLVLFFSQQPLEP